MSLTGPAWPSTSGGHPPLPAFVTLGGTKPGRRRAPRPRGVLDPTCFGRRSRTRSASSTAAADQKPVMFCRLTAILVTAIAIADATGLEPVTGAAGLGFQSRSRVALVHRAVRDLRRAVAEAAGAHRRRRSAGRARNDRAPAPSRRHARASARPSCARTMSSSSRRARRSPAMRRDRRPRFVNESAITGESAPVSGARHGHPQLGHGRHDAHQRPARDPRDEQPGETFLDRMIALVEGEAPADAQRDCAGDPAAGSPSCSSCDRHAAAVRPVRGRHD